jgi:hypothetical protein
MVTCENFKEKNSCSISNSQGSGACEMDEQQQILNLFKNYLMGYAAWNINAKEYEGIEVAAEVFNEMEEIFHCGWCPALNKLWDIMSKKNASLVAELKEARDQLKAFQPEASV